jgi:peroxiredoxin
MSLAKCASGILSLVGVLLLSACAPRNVATAPGPTPSPASLVAAATDAAPVGASQTPELAPTRPEATPTASADAATIVPVPGGQRPKPPQVGDQAVEFTLYDLAGHPVTLSDLRGKPVMLNFWASWCAPCNLEIPDIITVYQEYHERGLEIVAINIAEKPDRVSEFVARHGVPFIVVLDRSAEVRQAYYVRGLPTSIFIDEEGIIQAVHLGGLSEGLMRRYLHDLMDGEEHR